MAEAVAPKAQNPNVLRMTTEVVAAYLRRNPLPSGQISDVIASVYHSLKLLDGGQDGAYEGLKPAVPVKKSIQANYLVCLEDGKRLKMLKRHLRSTYNLTPQQYRAKWRLPPDYPMVAPGYAEQRSAFAKKIGLGRNGRRTPARASLKR